MTRERQSPDGATGKTRRRVPHVIVFIRRPFGASSPSSRRAGVPLRSTPACGLSPLRGLLCLRRAAPQTPPTFTPNFVGAPYKHRQRSHPTSLVCRTNTATAHFRLGCCAEQSQNIIDIFRNSTDISTNSIEIFGNINDILSLEGGINGFDADSGWVRSVDAPCFRCVAADFSLRRRRLSAAPRGERRGIVADGRGRRAGGCV